MKNAESKRWWAPAALAGLLVVTALMAGATSSARAADDDDDDVAPDTKFFRSVMRSIGLRKDGDNNGIDYRERSPLVVPPSRALPKPESAVKAEARTPDWPVDPDVKRAKEAKAERKKPRKTVEEESVQELPQELAKGRANMPNQQATGDSKDPTNPSTWSELGSKSFFSSWGNLWGRNKEEYATFSKEPPRASLLDPPTGYRTPSPNQPYGVGPAKAATSQAINPMDTAQQRGTQ